MKHIIFLSLLSLVLTACQSGEKSSNQYKSAEEAAERPLVDSKYSLAADRQAMEEYRTQVPETKKQENDELAMALGWTQNLDKQPSKIREQFNSLLKKKRAAIDKDLKKEREQFNKEERKKRDDFLKQQKDEREAFKKHKSTREESQSFFKDQSDRRNEFFANERERRNDFESDVRERRKNFEDYAREKTNTFNQDLRDYQKRYDEAKKVKKTDQSSLLQEIEAGLLEARQQGLTPLEAGE